MTTRQAIALLIVVALLGLGFLGYRSEQSNAERDACEYGNDLDADFGIGADDC